MDAWNKLVRPVTAAVVLILLVSLFWPGAAAFAHSNHDHKMYVAPFGVDQGSCDSFKQPCRTIMYAINKATGQGSEVRVAAGDYFFNPREVVLLIGRQVPVRGGFSARDGFTQQNLLLNPTYISGIDARYRDQLLAHGFLRVEDRTGRVDPDELTPGNSTDMFGFEANGIIHGRVNCTNGSALINGVSYQCSNLDFMSRIPLAEFTTQGGTNAATDGSNLWGHVDLNNGREYALIGVNNGTGVVDVTDPINPVIVGTVPGNDSIWREVKVYQYFDARADRWKAYAYISTEDSTQGLQIIDLNNLPNSVALATTYTADFGSSHTVYIKDVDYSTNTALPGTTPVLYMNGTAKNGSRLNRGAFRGFNINNPLAPVLMAEQPQNAGYTHDSTSLRIDDSRTADCQPGHNPCDLFIDYNETTVDIWDVTDIEQPYRISSTPYPGSGYTHSGWWTEDKMYVFIQDEFDEMDYGHNSRLRTLDISDLQNPQVTNVWDGPTKAIDHNGYTIGDTYYMSNYRRGVTLLDITDPNNPAEAAFFDTFPSSNSANFNGAWGVYPFLPSGNILVSDIEAGLWILRESGNSTVNQAITGMQVANDGPTELGQTTTFTATLGTGTDVSYTWSYGDGATDTSSVGEMVHQYASAGTYTVMVTATNTVNSVTKQMSVEVFEAPEAITGLQASSDGPTALGNATTLAATVATGNNITYSWDFGDGSAAAAGAQVAHTYAQAGTYTATVTASNDLGDVTASVEVEVLAEPAWRTFLPFISWLAPSLHTLVGR